jgi:cytochrome oxidase Cu insertion factor (SCO1/SenC/PrrC family)
MRSWVLTGLLAATLVTAPALAAGPDFEALQIEPYESPKPAPGFSLPDLDGKVRSLSDVRGKVVLLFFWATW